MVLPGLLWEFPASSGQREVCSPQRRNGSWEVVIFERFISRVVKLWSFCVCPKYYGPKVEHKLTTWHIFANVCLRRRQEDIVFVEGKGFVHPVLQVCMSDVLLTVWHHTFRPQDGMILANSYAKPQKDILHSTPSGSICLLLYNPPLKSNPIPQLNILRL